MKVRDRYLLTMAGVWVPCLALATACYAMVLHPQRQERRWLVAQIAQAKEHYTRAVAAAKPENQAVLTGEVERLQDRAADFLVDFEDAPELAFEIGRLAHENRLESFGMRPVGVQTSTVLPDSEYVATKHLNLSFNAGFTRFMAFLNGLERHRPVVFVETFNISRPQDPGAEPRIDMELAVLVERPRGN